MLSLAGSFSYSLTLPNYVSFFSQPFFQIVSLNITSLRIVNTFFSEREIGVGRVIGLELNLGL